MLIFPMLLGPFRPPKPENRICRGKHLMVTIHLFMHCNHLRSAGLRKVFELGIDRAKEVELLRTASL